MKSAIATLENVGTTLWSREYKSNVPPEEKETPDEYEARTWQNKAHTSKDGFVELPGLAFSNCVMAAAQRLGMKMEGSRNRTYTKHFESGVMVIDPLILPIHINDIQPLRLYVPAQPGKGKRGTGQRVWKNFPLIPEWKGDVTFYILDEVITKDVFQKHLEEAGAFIGIGAMRVENRGISGRFKVVKLKWDA